MTSDVAREQRAAGRRRRREREPETDELREGLKNAASAAAVGAAVGAARALAERRTRQAEPMAEDDPPAPEPEDHADRDEEPEQDYLEPNEGQDEPADRIEPATPSAIGDRVRQARSLLRELLDAEAESVSSVHRTGNGWKVGLVVLELRRIPDSTDILATYEVELDDDGGVLGIERTRRYHRSEADRGGRS